MPPPVAEHLHPWAVEHGRIAGEYVRPPSDRARIVASWDDIADDALAWVEQSAAFVNRWTTFVRWMRAPEGTPMRIRLAECSRGFERLAEPLAREERRVLVGASGGRAYPASALLSLAPDAIRSDPYITRCDEPDCRKCLDAIACGPLDAFTPA